MNLKQYIRDTVKEYIAVFKGKFASISGNSNINFSVKTPTSNNHATNYLFLQNYYLGKTAKATNSNKLNGKLSTEFANSSHSHSVNDVSMLGDRLGDLEAFHTRTNFALKNYYYWTDTISRQFSTSWGTGYTTPYISCHSKTRYVEFHFHILARNDSGSWGGLKMQLFVSVNGSSWTDLGLDHHGGNVMGTGATIGSHTNFYRLQLSSGANYVRFKFNHASFDGAATVNGSGTSGVFCSSFIAKEYRTVY